MSRFYLACAYARAGRAAAAEKILKELTEASRSKSHFIPAIAIAQIHAALGRKDEAIRTLEKAYEDGDYGSLLDLKVSPEWDGVRSDPRFALLVEKLGLR
jgi:predicted negative regulator of RcsB-dependent stress response